jgi:hypothetical protein
MRVSVQHPSAIRQILLSPILLSPIRLQHIIFCLQSVSSIPFQKIPFLGWCGGALPFQFVGCCIPQGHFMLRADVVYQIEDQAGITLNLAIVPGGLAATLQMPEFSDYKVLTGYRPWAESGFAMLAAAFAQFGPELSAVTGPLTQLEIRIASTATQASAANSLCVITLAGGRIQVGGPVLRMTWPVSEGDIADNLGDALRFVLTRCDPTIGAAHSTTTVPTYSGGTCEPFIFVNELPDAVQAWFVAMTKMTNPKALYRDGQTSTARAYADFCAGKI